jgi:hypothetical protein
LPEWDRAYFLSQVGVLKQQWTHAALGTNLRALLERGSPYYASRGFRGLLALLLVDQAARYHGKKMSARAETFERAIPYLY